MTITSYHLAPANLCTATAWLTQGHGFFQLECKQLNRTMGFSPTVINIENKLENFTPPKLLEFIPFLKKAAKAGGSLSMSWGSSSGWWSGKSLLHWGFQSIKAGNHLLSGSGLIYTHELDCLDQKAHGEVYDDTDYLKLCTKSGYLCAYSRNKISEEQAEKIYDFIRYEAQTHEDYRLLSNNCIDFMMRVMKVSGETNWKWAYTQPVTLTDQISSIAWNYFNLKSLSSKLPITLY